MFFFLGAVGWHLLSNRAALTSKTVRGRWWALGAVLIVSVLIDGFRLSWPDQTLLQYFRPWSATIKELEHLDLTSGRVWKWLGIFWITTPALLWFAGRTDLRARGMLPLYLVMLGLTIWQLRWGYFVALALAISLPWQLAAIRRTWLAVLAVVVGLIPMLWGWADHLRPPDEQQLATMDEYRRVAELMRSPERHPFLAPWWYSPQIAYWSRQPGVAGTSHQSLAGIVDTARFFLATKDEDAAAVLRARGVRWVIIDDRPITQEGPGAKENQYAPVNNAMRIMGLERLPRDAMGWKLAESGFNPPAYLRYLAPKDRGLVIGLATKENGELYQSSVKFYLPQVLKLYEVLPDKLTPPL
jgi:hypothetical protein